MKQLEHIYNIFTIILLFMKLIKLFIIKIFVDVKSKLKEIIDYSELYWI